MTTADFALPLPAIHRSVAGPAWLMRATYLLRVRARLNRRRRLRDILRATAHADAHARAQRWMLALPQSRHGG